MKRNRYTIYYNDNYNVLQKVKCASIRDAKSYISGNRDTLFSINNVINIWRGKEIYGSYILYNGSIIEIQKGDFRK